MKTTETQDARTERQLIWAIGQCRRKGDWDRADELSGRLQTMIDEGRACDLQLLVPVMGHRHLRDNRYLIIADNGGVLPYVVAEYVSGSDEWISGIYYADLASAIADYNAR